MLWNERGETGSGEGERQNYGSAKAGYFRLAAEMREGERGHAFVIHNVIPGLACQACVCLFAASYWRCWGGLDWSKVTEFGLLLFFFSPSPSRVMHQRRRIVVPPGLHLSEDTHRCFTIMGQNAKSQLIKRDFSCHCNIFRIFFHLQTAARASHIACRTWNNVQVILFTSCFAFLLLYCRLPLDFLVILLPTLFLSFKCAWLLVEDRLRL